MYIVKISNKQSDICCEDMNFCKSQKLCTFAPGEMAEWSIAAVLKTVEVQASGGSNPSLSAKLLTHTHIHIHTHFGEMPERSNGAVSKTVDLARGPGVRIPLSPQVFQIT